MPSKTPKDRSHLSVVPPAVVPPTPTPLPAADTSTGTTQPLVLAPEVASTARQLAELVLAASGVSAYLQANLEGYLRSVTGLDTLGSDYAFDHVRGVLMPKGMTATPPTND